MRYHRLADTRGVLPADLHDCDFFDLEFYHGVKQLIGISFYFVIHLLNLWNCQLVRYLWKQLLFLLFLSYNSYTMGDIEEMGALSQRSLVMTLEKSRSNVSF